MKKYLLSIAALLVLFSLQAQNTQKPCSAPEASQFDFWVGNWDLFSKDTITGTNTIYKIMDGCTVQENFASQKINYVGKSWSVYNPQAKLWQQTWVDNQGGYIELSGKFENGKMTLLTQAKKLPGGKEQVYRMVYSNVTAKTFDWDWESTTDGGITWVSGWKIHYVRK
jgi:hypothetical protein